MRLANFPRTATQRDMRYAGYHPHKCLSNAILVTTYLAETQYQRGGRIYGLQMQSEKSDGRAEKLAVWLVGGLEESSSSWW